MTVVLGFVVEETPNIVTRIDRSGGLRTRRYYVRGVFSVTLEKSYIINLTGGKSLRSNMDPIFLFFFRQRSIL